MCEVLYLRLIGTNWLSMDLQSTQLDYLAFNQVRLSKFRDPLLNFHSIRDSQDNFTISMVNCTFNDFFGTLFSFEAPFPLDLSLQSCLFDGYSNFGFINLGIFHLKLAKGSSVITFSDSMFSNNTGSVIWTDVQSVIDIDISDCLFYDHSKSSVIHLSGGGRSSSTALQISSSVFSNNVIAGLDGSCIYADLKSLDLMIESSRFFGNEAQSGPVMSLSGTDTLMIKDCWFENNKASERGVIHMVSAKMDFQLMDSVFRGNHAQKGSVMSVDVLQESVFIVIGCEFIGNDVSQSGGVFFLDNIKQTPGLNLSDCLFANNSAGDSGGSILVSDASDGAGSTDEVYVSIDRCRFDNNSALSGSAGALSVVTVPLLLIDDSQFVDNHSPMNPHSADMHFEGRSMRSHRSSFGSMFLRRDSFDDSEVSMYDCRMEGRQGEWIMEEMVVQMTECDFNADQSRLVAVKSPWLSLSNSSSMKEDTQIILDYTDRVIGDGMDPSEVVIKGNDPRLEVTIANGGYGTLQLSHDLDHSARSMPISIRVSSEQSGVYPGQKLFLKVSAEDMFGNAHPLTDHERWDQSTEVSFQFILRVQCEDESVDLYQSPNPFNLTDDDIELSVPQMCQVGSTLTITADRPLSDSYWPVSRNETYPLMVRSQDCPEKESLFLVWKNDQRTRYECDQNKAISTKTFDPTDSAGFDFLSLLIYLVLFSVASVTIYSWLIDRVKCVPRFGPFEKFGHSPGKQHAVLVYLLQIVDFISDVLLAGTLWNVYLAVRHRKNQAVDSRAWLALAILASLFTVLPCLLNLYFTVHLSALLHRVCEHNSVALRFARDRKYLIILCVLWSAGVIPTLQLFNSRLFHWSIFDMGLSQFELQRLHHLKFFATTVSENLPQVCVQIAVLVLESVTGNSNAFSGIIMFSLLSSGIAITTCAIAFLWELNEPEKHLLPFQLTIHVTLDKPVGNLKIHAFYPRVRPVHFAIANAFTLDTGSSINIGSLRASATVIDIFGYFNLDVKDWQNRESLNIHSGHLDESHPHIGMTVARMCIDTKRRSIVNTTATLTMFDAEGQMDDHTDNDLQSVFSDTSMSGDSEL